MTIEATDADDGIDCLRFEVVRQLIVVHTRGRFVLDVLAIVCGMAIAGCDPGTTPKDRGEPLDLSQEEIKAGWGIEYCHIGMTIDDCIRVLGNPDVRLIDSDEFSDGRMSWHKLGLMIAFKDERVVQVYFDYLSSEYSPFQGRLYPVANDASPMLAVNSQFGKPSEVHKVRISSWLPPADKEFFEKNLAGKMETSYVYPELGIDIVFVEDRVEYVRVYVPQPEN